MNTLLSKPQITPEDLLSMSDSVSYELVDGRLVERPMGLKSSRISGKLLRLMGNFCDANSMGWLFNADAGYQCFPDAPNKVRKPDVSFIRKERLPADQEPEGHSLIAPDLAVESISPNDLFEEVAVKVEEYLTAGVQLVWVLVPSTRTVLVYRPSGPGTILRASDELSGEDVLPGFRCRVSDIFQPPPGTGPAA
jgi:Uma2 family endonuclease